MAREKKERKVIKIGTHGRTNVREHKDQQQKYEANGEPKKTLRDVDEKAWKARKEKKQKARAAVRALAKKQGIKLGRWRGGLAFAKHNSKGDAMVCGVIGSPKVPEGFRTIEKAS